MQRSCGFRFRSSAGVLLATVALSAIPSLFAQEAAKPEWSIVTIATIKPDMRAEFENFQKEITAAYKKADVPARAVLQTMLGNTMQYITVSPLARFADMDGPSPLERALGKADAAGLMRKGTAYVTSLQRMVSVVRPGMSIRTKTSEPSEYALVTSVHVVLGKVDEYNAFMKDVYLPAIKKAEVKNFWVNESVFGGDPNERVTVRLIKNMAEFDNGPVLRRSLGEEGARKIMSQMAGLVESVHYSVLHYRADLSYEKASGTQTASAK